MKIFTNHLYSQIDVHSHQHKSGTAQYPMAMCYDNADGQSIKTLIFCATTAGVNSYISWQTLLILVVWYNHHKMYAVLHKTPPTCCKLPTNVVVFFYKTFALIMQGYIFISILHTLGFQCWLSEWGWSHRLGAGTRSQADRKYAGTPLPARGPHMPRLRKQITKVDKPSSSKLTVVNNRQILTVKFKFLGRVLTHGFASVPLKERSLCLVEVHAVSKMNERKRPRQHIYIYSGNPLSRATGSNLRMVRPSLMSVV